MKIYRFKPKHQKNALFIKLLAGVGVVMVLAMLLLGSIIITQALLPQEAEFEAPPPPPPNKEPERRQRVVLQKNVKRSSTQVKRINVPVMNQINPPELTISLPSGMGGEGSTINDISLAGANLQGVKINLPTMEIFGTKATSDRVFIAFDVSEEIMKDNMGGLDAFNVVKDEIKNLVKNLPGTVIFNVMAFDVHRRPELASPFKTLVAANPQNKEIFEKWIDEINKDPMKVGLKKKDKNSYTLKNPVPPYPQISYKGARGHNNGVVGRYMVHQAALEFGAGAIWILSMGWPSPTSYNMGLSEEALKSYNNQWEKNVQNFERSGGKMGSAEDKAAWNKYMAPLRKKAKDWLEKENKRRESKGIPKMVETDMDKILRNNLKIQYDRRPYEREDLRPPVPSFKKYTPQTLYSAYEPIMRANYDSKQMPRPRENIIVLLPRDTDWDSRKSAAAKAWTRINSGGTIRIVKAGKPVAEYEE